MNLPPAWRVRWWLWVVPLALALANAVLLIVHPGRTGAGYADMERELERETLALQAMAEKERAIAAVLADAQSSREALADIYLRGFSTESERLTQLIAEVKRLAQRAGLKPSSISYPEDTLEEYGLVRMSLLFGVQGTYPQLRMLVNLLERSDLFLVLERVALGGSRESTLNINLEIATYFVDAKLAGDPEAFETDTPRSEPAADDPSGEARGERSTTRPPSPRTPLGQRNAES